jgi:hypothetical protein
LAAGFVDFEITWRADVFSGAPQSSSAANYGTLGINFRARKALNDAEWEQALAAWSCATTVQPTSLFGADALYDAGDLPAWCRLAGHELVQQDGDRYLIRRRG